MTLILQVYYGVRHGDTAAVPNYVLNNFICTLNDYDVWLGRYVA